MSNPVDLPIVCPLIVGRSGHLDAIATRIDRLALGTGWTIQLTGEAGIGKTRLVAEAARLARQHGMDVLEGHAYERDQDFPFAQFIDLIQRYGAEHAADEVEHYIGPVAADIAHVVPDVPFWIPSVIASPVEEPARERRRLFHAITRLITNLSTTRPILLIFGRPALG